MGFETWGVTTGTTGVGPFDYRRRCCSSIMSLNGSRSVAVLELTKGVSEDGGFLNVFEGG